MADQSTSVVNIPNQERIHQLFWMYLGRSATLPELDTYGNLPEANLIGDLGIMKSNQEAEAANRQAIQQNMLETGQGATAFHMDPTNGSFVAFGEDMDGAGPATAQTVWWAQPSSNTLRPIMTQAAYGALTGGRNMAEDLRNGTVNVVPKAFLTANYPLAGYQLLNASEAVKDDGTYNSSYSSVNTSALANKYGKQPVSDSVVSDWTQNRIGGYLTNVLMPDSNYAVDNSFIQQIMNNPNLMQLYTGATLYGGYSLADVAKDIKRRYLVSQGKTDLSNLKLIDESSPASDYYNTTQYSSANTNPSIALPAKLAGIDIQTLQNPVFNLPPEVFSVLVPPLDPNTDAGKAEIAKIQAGMYDIVQAQLDAKTEQQRVVAQGMYDDFKKQLENKYNIQLSTDAMAAWNQLNDYFNTLGQRGILNSGIGNEQIDNYLRSVREKDRQLRESQMNEADAAEYEYLSKYGTPEQINALSEDKKIKYGFKPSAEVAASLSKENLKKLYPTATDERINELYNENFDQYGNMKSALYSDLYAKKFGTAAGTLPVGDTGTGLAGAKSTFQQEQAQANKLAAEDKAYKEFTGAGIGEKAPATSTPTNPTVTPANGTNTTGTNLDLKNTQNLNTPAYDWDAAWQAVNLSPIPEFNAAWGADTGDRVNWALQHRKNIWEAGKEILGRPLTPGEVNQRLQQSGDINFIKGEFSNSPEAAKYKASLGGL